MYTKKLIKTLCAVNGTSGDESRVRETIIALLPEDVVYKIDALGNLIVEKTGAAKPKQKLMFAAHMDEVGFIATDIDEKGLISFAPVGGIMPSAIFGRQVVFSSGVRGAVAGKPLHLLKDDEKNSQPKISDLKIDIGANSKDEALKLVSLGDTAYFTGEAEDLGDGLMVGKALDDRVGCAIMIALMNKKLPYSCTFVFTVQEEVGTRGARAAAFSANADIGVVLEATTACDISGVEGEKKVCSLGNGPVISFMDKRTIYDRELYKIAFSAAEELGIKCQTKTAVAGGNDAGAIQCASGGTRMSAISVPCRYLHTANCVINELDLKQTEMLAETLIEKYGNLKK